MTNERRATSLRVTAVAAWVLCSLGAGLGGGAARGQDVPGMRYPLSVAAAPDGTIVVADRQLPGLWRIADGKATVLYQGEKRFRTPLNAVRAVAVGRDGTVFAADSSTRDVYRIAADGTAAPLSGGRIGIPVDLAIAASGDLYVSDLETQSIWRLPAAGGEPRKLAELAAPRGLFVDAADRLWAVAASGEAPLVRVGADGAVEPVVKTRAFEFPHDVVVRDGPGGPVALVSDNYARTIWQVAADGTASPWIAGPPLVGPVGLAVAGDDVLVADPQARMIFRVGGDGRPQPVGGPAP